MDKSSITITVNNIDEAKKELKAKMPQILEALGLEAEGNAVDEITKLVYDTPESPNYIRTGDLRESITHAKDDEAAYIGTDIEYAPYVEMGTRHMAPRPFLRNAITNYKDSYKKIVEDALKA